MSSYSYQNYKLDNHTGGVSCLSYPMTLHILSFIHVSKFNVHNIPIRMDWQSIILELDWQSINLFLHDIYYGNTYIVQQKWNTLLIYSCSRLRLRATFGHHASGYEESTRVQSKLFSWLFHYLNIPTPRS